MKKKLIQTLLLLCPLLGCTEERILPDRPGSTVRLSLTLEEGAAPKSSAISDEDLLTDMNIWIYSSSGSLRETHYIESLSIRGSGSVSFGTGAGGRSRLVVIANAGRELAAPVSWSQRVDITFCLPQDGSGRILFVGEANLGLGTDGFNASVHLCRGMARIGLRLQLSEALAAEGAQLGRDVRILSARLRNCPLGVSLLPSSATNSLRYFKAEQAATLTDGDYLDAGDIAALQSGGTVYLYSLPNYSDLPYSAEPGSGYECSTYLEMCFESDALAMSGPGRTMCRFYANDGERVGLVGGCSYLCRVIFSNNAAENEWRKEDYRFSLPGTLVAGTRNPISLLSANHHPDSLSFSLSSVPGISSDGIFSLGEKVLSSGRCAGVEVIPLRAGTGELNVFDAKGNIMGELVLNAEYADFHVQPISADVCGITQPIVVTGLEDAYARRASDELFTSLYSLSGISSAGPENGIDPEAFITVDDQGQRVYVGMLNWDADGCSHSWEDVVGMSFQYRLSLSCGAYRNFDIEIENGIVGRFASDAYYGEVVNTSEVPDPKNPVRALDGRDITIERRGVSLPPDLDDEWPWNGWASWYGGSTAGGGYPAGNYMSVLEDGLRWDFGEDVTQNLYGADIPVFIGKYNPWCGEYVRTCVGHYSSTKYLPSGLEHAFLQYDIYGLGIISMLVFREHDTWTSIDVSSAMEGDEISHDAANLLGLESGNASWYEAGRRCFMIFYSGDVLQRFSPDISWGRDICSSSAFANRSIWQQESCSVPWNKYAAIAYGGNGSYNRWIYLYCPYNSTGVYAADASGRVPARGLVPVQLWSVSQKACLEYQPSEEWYDGCNFTPPWR